MARRLPVTIFLVLMLAAAGHGQTPPSFSAGITRIFILLKPSLAEPGAARDAFAQRMAALGVVNLQFITGVSAVRCEAPASAQSAISVDSDVSGVLSVDSAPGPVSGLAPPSPVAPPSAPTPVIATPPYMPPQQTMPISTGIPMGGGPGGGMSAGMAILTDLAGNVVVKLFTPASGCKVRLHRPAVPIPSAGGAGAFEVKASGNCAWQAVSTADWLRVKTEVNSAGTVAVTYSAPTNSGVPRQAVVVIQPVGGMGSLNGHTVMLVAQQ